jgi:hypothetical protein
LSFCLAVLPISNSVVSGALFGAAVGIDPAGTAPLRRPGKDPFHRELLRERIAELK